MTFYCESIEDTAVSYNPKQAEQLEEEVFKLPLEQRKLGGMGLYLAIQGVNKFFYERFGDRNRNIFVVNRQTN